MEKVDFRKHEVKVQEAFRARAVRLVEEEGCTETRAAEVIGVSRQTVSGWIRGYRKQGKEFLQDRRKNEHKKSARILSDKEITQVKDWVKDKTPEQLKLSFALWTSRAIRDLIKHKLKKKVSLSTVQNYLKQWGYTPQKPLRQAKQRNAVAVEKWLKEDYPKIASRAKKEKATILWGDETCIKNHDQIGRSYAPKGQTPVVEKDAKKFKTNMISAISNRGDGHFMLYEENLNVKLFLKFIKQLVRQFEGKKLVLIVDNLRVHHAKLVKKFVSHKLVKNYIQLEYLPAYAPEHNPDEYLNNDIKQKLSQIPAPKDIKTLKENTTTHLNKIIQKPENIKAYFRHKHIKYAA